MKYLERLSIENIRDIAKLLTGPYFQEVLSVEKRKESLLLTVKHGYTAHGEDVSFAEAYELFRDDVVFLNYEPLEGGCAGTYRRFMFELFGEDYFLDLIEKLQLKSSPWKRKESSLLN